jgi:hypothetical protein
LSANVERHFRIGTQPRDDEKQFLGAKKHDGPALRQARRHLEVRCVLLRSLLIHRRRRLRDRRSGLSEQTNAIVDGTKALPRSISRSDPFCRGPHGQVVRAPDEEPRDDTVEYRDDPTSEG